MRLLLPLAWRVAGLALWRRVALVRRVDLPLAAAPPVYTLMAPGVSLLHSLPSAVW